MEMKKCKECGKLFMPKSMRSQYCDDLHYRPCPVCSKPVEAKYLSDPPRCCSKECQQAMRKATVSSTCKVVKIEPVSSITKLVADEVQTYKDKIATSVNLDDSIREYEDFLSECCTCAAYIGHPTLQFIPGHRYALEITREVNSPYMIHAIYDFTTSSECNLWIPLSSKVSINQYFTTSEVILRSDGGLEVKGDGPIYSIA